MKYVILATALAAVSAGPLAGQSFRTLSNSRQVSKETSLFVNVEFAAGRFRLGRDASGALYHSKLAYNEDRFRPVLDYADGDLHVGIRTNSGKSNLNLDNHEYDKQYMELNISPKVPAKLDLTFAAGEADLDLGGLNLSSALIKTGASKSNVDFSVPTTGTCDHLEFQVGAAEFRVERIANSRCRDLDFSGGAGDLTLDFTGDWGSVTAVNADIAIGVGSLKLNLPRDVGVEIQMNKFLASFDRTGLVKRGGSYYSANWENAAVRMHMDITAALGSVDIAWK